MSDEVKWEGSESLRAFLVPVGDLRKHPDNPMDPHHALAITASLRGYTQVRPILTWENGEEFGFEPNTIIGGHHVWLGAQDERLGWTHVAAVPAKFESPEAAKRYLVLDNLLTQRTGQRLDDQLTLGEEVGALDELDEKEREAMEALRDHGPEMAPVAELKQHERSTRKEPDDLIEHIASQLKEHGILEPVIVARDGTILKGEAVFRAAAVMGMDKVPVVRKDIDPDSPEALKIMALDYVEGRRTMVDDRAFAEMLKELKDELDTLEGTGFDVEALGALLLMTRSASEIKDANQAMEWIGLPEYERIALPSKLTISFDDPEARELFLLERMPEAIVRKRHLHNLSMFWPPRERDDPHSLRFVGARPSDLEGDSDA